jgi:hypothetical protein
LLEIAVKNAPEDAKLVTPVRYCWQISNGALTRMRNLTIKKSILSPIRKENDVDSAQWLELFAPLSSVQMVNVSEEFVADVVQGLGMA